MRQYKRTIVIIQCMRRIDRITRICRISELKLHFIYLIGFQIHFPRLECTKITILERCFTIEQEAPTFRLRARPITDSPHEIVIFFICTWVPFKQSKNAHIVDTCEGRSWLRIFKWLTQWIERVRALFILDFIWYSIEISIWHFWVCSQNILIPVLYAITISVQFAPIDFRGFLQIRNVFIQGIVSILVLPTICVKVSIGIICKWICFENCLCHTPNRSLVRFVLVLNSIIINVFLRVQWRVKTVFV